MDQAPHRFSYHLIRQDGSARLGEIRTPRGIIRTPAFMPVGTVATVKALYPEQVREAGADIILGNTYHLMLRPGAERMARLGGLHSFMRWDGPILTDSGGFQVMSLSKIRKITEEGAQFQSHIDGSRHMLSPERSIEIQCLLGSDIQMQFDECIELPAERKDVERAMELSLRWAERSKPNPGKRCSPSFKAVLTLNCASDLRVNWLPWTSPAMRSAASQSVRVMRRWLQHCQRRCLICQTPNHAI
jgi:tRNA-guanine transglycosylase